MKKLIVALLFGCACSVAKADATDLIEKTLLDHVTTVTQFANGETKVALLDSVILIGKNQGKSILDLQFGFSGDTNPGENEVQGVNYVASAFFKISSLLGDSVKFPEHWSFLRSLEHGVAYSYDLREHKGYASYQVGLAFKLNPKQ